MEQQREETKKRSDKNIDKLYAEAIKVGEANPGYQDAIVQTTQLANALFFEVWDSVKSYVIDLVKDIIAWAINAWESITSTFQSITITISGWFDFNAGKLQPN